MSPRIFTFKKRLTSTVLPYLYQLSNFFYHYPYTRDILIGVAIGSITIACITAAAMTWGTFLLPSIIGASAIIGGKLGSIGGLAIITGSVLFGSGLIATGWSYLLNKFSSKQTKISKIEVNTTHEDNPVKQATVVNNTESIIKATMQQSDKTVTATRTSLETIPEKKPVQNPYKSTYFIGGDAVKDYLENLEPDELPTTVKSRPRSLKNTSSSPQPVYGPKDIENVICFIHRNIEFFTSLFINRDKFNKWAEKNLSEDCSESNDYLSFVLMGCSILPVKEALRRVTNTPPLLAYQEALLGSHHLSKLPDEILSKGNYLKDSFNDIASSGLTDGNKEPMRLLLKKNLSLLEEFLIMSNNNEIKAIIQKWYDDNGVNRKNSHRMKNFMNDWTRPGLVEQTQMPITFGR